MLIGLHGPNRAFTEQDYEVVKAMKAKSVLLMHTHATQHSAEEIAHLRSIGVEHFTMRLYDTVWQGPNGAYIPSFWDYGDACVEVIRWGVEQGIFDYVFSNEDNIAWYPHGKSEWDYRVFVSDLYHYIKTLLIEYEKRGLSADLYKVRLGFPPIAVATDPKYRPYEWLRVLKDVAADWDFISVHSYYQSSRRGHDNILQGPLASEQFGASYKWYHKNFSNKPLVVSEWGNSIFEQGRHTPQELEAFNIEQYPIWQQQAMDTGYVESAYCFISPGATDDWDGFKITPRVANAMRLAQVEGVLTQ